MEAYINSQQDNMCNLLFANLPIGIIMLDKDRVVIEANKYMYDYFSMQKQNMGEQRFGNFFKCEHAEAGNYKCGTGEPCKTCSIKKAADLIINSSETISEEEIKHNFILNGRSSEKWFSIYATSVMKDNEKYIISSFTDITNRKKTEDDLIKLGITDELTNIYNRRYIMERCRKLVNSESTADTNCSIAIIDVDKFKSVNDIYGHVVGDFVLKSLTKIAKDNLRSTDLIGRYGGEEFLIIAPNTDITEAQNSIFRINSLFAKQMKKEVGKSITFSCGLTKISKDDFKEKDILKIIERAYKLLYKAKENGRNRIEI